MDTIGRKVRLLLGDLGGCVAGADRVQLAHHAVPVARGRHPLELPLKTCQTH